MGVDERRQRPEILNGQPCDPHGLAEPPLQQQSIDIDQSIVEQGQGEQGEVLIFSPIRRDIPAFSKEEELIRTVPRLDDIEPLVNLPAEFAQPQGATEEDGPARFAEFQEGAGGGMLAIVSCKTTQNRVGVRRAQA
jgi:hypothetical protein